MTRDAEWQSAGMDVTTDPAVVGISMGCEPTKRAAERAINDLHRSVSLVRVLVGGPAGEGEEDSVGLGVDGWAPAAVGAARLVEEQAR